MVLLSHGAAAVCFAFCSSPNIVTYWLTSTRHTPPCLLGQMQTSFLLGKVDLCRGSVLERLMDTLLIVKA